MDGNNLVLFIDSPVDNVNDSVGGFVEPGF